MSNEEVLWPGLYFRSPTDLAVTERKEYVPGISKLVFAGRNYPGTGLCNGSVFLQPLTQVEKTLSL